MGHWQELEAHDMDFAAGVALGLRDVARKMARPSDPLGPAAAAQRQIQEVVELFRIGREANPGVLGDFVEVIEMGAAEIRRQIEEDCEGPIT
jgi:hypothetical protein